jgi:transposase-like protein
MTATVLSGPEQRRRWTTAEKLRIVQESLNCGISVVEFPRQRDLHPNLVHTWRWQARKGFLSANSHGEARFAPVSIVPVADAMRPVINETRDTAVIEVVLRNGRILRLPECTAPEHAARVADALEAGGR